LYSKARRLSAAHVRRRHALVDEPRLRPDDLGEVGQERDDVMLDLALDLVDPRNVEHGVLALGPQRGRGLLRHDAERGEGIGRVGLDLEPDPVARLRVPDRGHLRPSVAGDHAAALPEWRRRSNHNGVRDRFCR
jgi:hypothetical protein